MRRMDAVVGIVVLALVAVSANAANYESSGWETFPIGDTGSGVYAVDSPKPDDWTEPILGNYSLITEIVTGATDPVYSGEKSLKLTDGGEAGTPEAFVGLMKGRNFGKLLMKVE